MPTQEFGVIAWVLLVGLLSACSGAARDERQSGDFELLALAKAWVAVDRDADPFVTDLAAAPRCQAPGFATEGDWLELNTGACNWITLEQPMRFAVARGQELNVALAHFDLVAPEPALARVAVSLGSCRGWTKSVRIPADAAVYDERFASACGASAGDMLRFHLHNHGQNSWQLQRIAVLR